MHYSVAKTMEIHVFSYGIQKMLVFKCMLFLEIIKNRYTE